jgi:hypothetical protein
MRGQRSVEYNQPVHELGNQDQPGPGEWLAVARRIVTLGAGATAIVEKIDALTAGADPRELPPPHPEEAEVFVMPFPRPANKVHHEQAA